MGDQRESTKVTRVPKPEEAVVHFNPHTPLYG